MSTYYLANPFRIGIIFGSFFVFTLPFVLFNSYLHLIPYLLYAILLGGTHFAISFALYLKSDNLRYFASSPQNFLIYFVLPFLLLLFMFLNGLLGLSEMGVLGVVILSSVKALDYFHVVRQHFGVLQLFKLQSMGRFLSVSRHSENYFFINMAILQMIVFLQFFGWFPPRYYRAAMTIGITLAGVLFVLILVNFALALRGAKSRISVLVPFSYFLLQTTSASLPVYRTQFYLASLAMHYIEYHVLIYPRIFWTPLDPKNIVDRAAFWFRNHWIFFYFLAALIFAISLGAGSKSHFSAPSGEKDFLLVFINVFAGINVFHYYIDAFVWKFKKEYYKKTLSPIYFP